MNNLTFHLFLFLSLIISDVSELQNNTINTNARPPFLEKQSDQHHISISCTEGCFSATIQTPSGSIINIDPSQIKCGIKGNISKSDFIRSIDQIARERLVICAYRSLESPTEVWGFETTPLAAPAIKKAKEYLKQNHPREAIKHLEIALKLEQQQKRDTAELNAAILELKKELFLHQSESDSPLYLPSEEVVKFKETIDLYREQENPFPLWSEYLHALGLKHPHLYYLSAVLSEHEGKCVEAAPHYLYLALKHPTPLYCLKKAAELVKSSSDPLAFAHFLERLDREWLIQLNETIQDPELNHWVILKDAVRIAFEDCLAELSLFSSQAHAPTCFICFNVEEIDVGKWLAQILVPDLDRVGIKPLFSFRDLGPGKELNTFQGLIRHVDQVILVCTPELKRKCDERKKAPTGVAQEVRIARERFNDPDKYETIFPLYLKGDRKASCPSEFFEPILGTQFTYLAKSTEMSVFSYYSQVFELFGGMRKIPREFSRKMKEAFINRTNKILKGEIDQQGLEKWREAKTSKVKAILNSVQERLAQKTQILNLPESPKDFTGRVQELKNLHEACQQKRRVAITGLGGIGKTTLALKYANDYQSHYQFIHFMPAGTPELVIDGLLKLADDLHIPKSEKLEDRLLWLKTTLNRFEQDYLIIFDGIDQLKAFEEVTKYLPERGHCLLLTTRMPEQSNIRGFELIPMNPLSLEEAICYLLRATGSTETKAAEALTEKLGRFPLALTHAARYIQSQKISIKRYFEELNQYQLELFDEKNLTLSTEEKTILFTWKISLNAIGELLSSRLGSEILDFFSFLGQAPIPRELVERWFSITHPEKSGLELRNALRHLSGYSMFTSGLPNTYNVHLLVQNITHYQIPKESRPKVFKQVLVAISQQLKQFEEKNIETWDSAKLCMPHAIAIFEQDNLISSLDQKDQCEFMLSLNEICRTLGNAQQALKISRKCLDIAKEWDRKDTSNKETTKILALSLNHHAEDLQKLGKDKEALELFQKALSLRQKLYGELHPEVAISINCIGLALQNLGQTEQARESYLKALQIRKDLFGLKHHDVAVSLNNVGTFDDTPERKKEALEFCGQALEIYKELYGEIHPDIALCLNNMGTVLYNLNRFEEALEKFQESLRMRYSFYSKDHLKIAIVLNNIGKTLQNLGRLNQALEIQIESLKILENYYDKSHPKIAKSLNNIGETLCLLGEYKQALEYHERALTIFEEFYPDQQHQNLALSLENNGKLQLNLGRTEKALEYFQRSLKIYQFHLKDFEKINELKTQVRNLQGFSI